MDRRSALIARRFLWSAAGAGGCALIAVLSSAMPLGGKFIQPFAAIFVCALFVGAILGCFLLFNGVTWVSLQLHGRARSVFNVVGTFAIPLGLSLFFVDGDLDGTVRGVISDTPSARFLIPLTVAVVMAFAAAMDFDRDHPIGGFMVISIVAWLFYMGLYYGLLIMIAVDDTGKLQGMLKTLRVDLLRQFIWLVCAAYIAVGVRRWTVGPSE